MYFVSLGRVLDPQTRELTTWLPEALYRYLLALPGEPPSADLLQQCMLQRYYPGVSFIDKPRYLRFFGPTIRESRISFSEQKEKYLRGTENAFSAQLDEMFEGTPDLEKPFFASQMGWRLAHRTEQELAVTRREMVQLSRRAIEAEAEVSRLTAEKEAKWKSRAKKQDAEEQARLRNLQDPKHVRKRQRQKNKREREKRK